MSESFRAIDGNNDWQFGGGKSSYFNEEQAIDADIQTALQIFLGECFFATKDGVDWWNLIGGRNPSAQQGIILQCRTVILGRYGVVKVNSISPVLDQQRNLVVNYNVDTIYTRGLASSATIPS